MLLAHQLAGEGPLLVILHGLFGSSSNWRAMARRLQEHYTTCVVDLRNHGRSPHQVGMSYAELAGDVLALLDHLQASTCCVLGHSMGGKTAMRLALTHPDRVSALIVADIAPSASTSDNASLLVVLRELPVTRLRNRAEADAALARHVQAPELRGFLLQNLERSTSGFRWRIPLDLIERALPDLQAFALTRGQRPYPGPALFVRGELSDYLLDEHQALIRQLFPRFELQTIAGAGHWLHAEQPDAFYALVSHFLHRFQSV